jgi:hypothetical protein
MRYCAVYDTQTGKIVKHISSVSLNDAFSVLNTPVGCAIYDGEVDSEVFYILDGTPTERPAISLTVSATELDISASETATISGLPIPCDVSFSGPITLDPATVTDGELEFSADIPGGYTLTFSAFPYLDSVVTINAV